MDKWIVDRNEKLIEKCQGEAIKNHAEDVRRRSFKALLEATKIVTQEEHILSSFGEPINERFCEMRNHEEN